MSADNGVYIGCWLPQKNPENLHELGELEYRVIHATAIDNCDYDSTGRFPEEFIDASVVDYFGDAKVFYNLNEARREAHRIMDEIEANGWWTEYGICQINFDRPFPTITREEGKQIQNNFWLSIGRPDCCRE